MSPSSSLVSWGNTGEDTGDTGNGEPRPQPRQHLLPPDQGLSYSNLLLRPLQLCVLLTSI